MTVDGSLTLGSGAESGSRGAVSLARSGDNIKRERAYHRNVAERVFLV
jgi:hypothetical protein